MPLLRAALLAVIAAGAAAQTAPRSAEPDARFAPLDAPLPGGRPAILSPAPAGSPPQAAPAGIDVSMILREIVIRPGGAALAATPGIGAAMDAFRGREVGLAELERLRRRMTEALVSAGYVSSGALLREIDLDAGAAVFELVEGRLTGVAVAGDGVADGPRAPLEITADYVRGRLAFPAGPFNLNEAEERLRILLRDRAIARVDAEIRPGAAPGDTALAIEATRARPYDLSVAFANDTPDGIGEETARLNAALRNVLTSGDELRAEAELSEGRRRAIVEGDAPLHPGGPAPFFTAEYSTSAFVTRPLGDLDVEN